MTIGEALKNIRLHAGLTQKQMAADIVSESFYSRVERDVHAINADTLMKILSAHHFDVTGFFALINNQSASDPFFDLVNEIVYAQNRKDLRKLNQIKGKIEKSNKEIPERIKLRLAMSEAWIRHSNENVPLVMQKKIKSLIFNGNWGRVGYHFLSQAVILFDIEDAYQLTNLAFENYHQHPAKDTFTLQFISLVAINYLNCCWHQKADKKYTVKALSFLQNALPPDPAIGLEKILRIYYQALFDHDQKKIKNMILILQESGYGSTIQDTLE